MLRKIEAYGFKSFAEKTELEFGPGITAIVGPNGSGKSNISDAIRWALGEQSVRTLRGAKMEDVIFAGSANRRPLGVAEVSLTFDNSEGRLPIEFNEVTLTRRVFRSGDSEYYINKAPCRLKDIHELLADTGLGKDSMTVIGQNKIDEVLNNKPEERRLLFEEASGITKYKHRKREAQRKLEDTEHNLVRVNDITSELEGQLEPLAESAGRTRQHHELYRELTACQVTLLLQKLTKAEKMVESAQLEKASLQDQESSSAARLAVSEAERERLTDELAGTDEQLSKVDADLVSSATALERNEGKHAVLTERMEQQRRARERVAEELGRLVVQRREQQQGMEMLRQELERKQAEWTQWREELRQEESRQRDGATAIRQMEDDLERGKSKTFEQLQAVVDQRNSLRTMERDSQSLQARRENQRRELSEYQGLLAEQQQQVAAAKNEQLEMQTRMEDCRQETANLEQQHRQWEAERQQLRQQEQLLARQTNESASRLKVLTGMQKEYEGFGRGIRSILKCRENPEPDYGWARGICGAVAAILKVPDEYVTAVEIALGGALQHMIVEDDGVAKQAIQYLKRMNLGRATFLPLNTVKKSQPRDAELTAVRRSGALGFAADLVECDPRYRSVIQFLLGRTVVARTIDEGLDIARAAGFSVKVVTLGGELLNPGGSMTGGSLGRKEVSFLSRSNEIQELEAKVAALRQETEQTAATALRLDQTLAQLQQRLREVQTRVQEIEVRRAELVVRLEKSQADQNRLQMAVQTVTTETGAAQQELELLAQRMGQAQARISELEASEGGHKQQMVEWQQQLQELKRQQERMQEALTEIKIKVGARQQELASRETDRRREAEALASLERQWQRLQEEEQQLTQQMETAVRERESLTAEKEQLLVRRQECEQQRTQVYAAKMATLAAQQKLEKELKDLRRRSQDAQNRLHEMELMATKYAYEVTSCREQLTEYYLLSREQAEFLRREEAAETLLAAVRRLENEIASLGPVNPAAMEEYDRVRERYRFLKTQYQDLVEAKNYLASVIQDIDKTMSQQFIKAFREIDGHFGETFRKMFGGGEAKLVLLEPDQVLDSGIDIVVQPPGKKSQNLALLSGGERALTVIALLFAFLSYRPSPFCVADEIDAALDEANVQRFGEFLTDFARHTQFIIVTHRKGTMEVADVMHGVTMEESGISRLISVKLVEKAG
ncbi:MAG TPA: chromosome segregation protein SMC [Patescibacteria group bacterium]|nr:chromosome segregation protein SMC [Patescibacteria group bacterium]